MQYGEGSVLIILNSTTLIHECTAKMSPVYTLKIYNNNFSIQCRILHSAHATHCSCTPLIKIIPSCTGRYDSLKYGLRKALKMLLWNHQTVCDVQMTEA